MLDEMSTSDADAFSPETDAITLEDKTMDPIRAAVAEVFQIEREVQSPDENVVVIFTGSLVMDSEEAYEQLDSHLQPLGCVALFREQPGEQVIQVVAGRFDPRPRSWWPNAILLVLTLLSLLYTGAGIALGEALIDAPSRQLAEFWRGWPYALSLLLILGAHELGHYFAARWHKIPVTLPYFIPLPFGFFGTLGAFIQLRAPIRNRKMLLDVGVSGPLAGMVFAVPILLIGLATAPVQNLPTEGIYLMEGNSILYALAKIMTFGRFLPDGHMDVFINQLTQAGWTGLFVTGLNLIPIGQLDGGHVVFTLFGNRARGLYLPAVIIMFVLALTVSDAWYLWVFLLILFGRVYATPLDMITPLDGRRRALGILALVVFVLVFVPNPLQIVEATPAVPVDIF